MNDAWPRRRLGDLFEIGAGKTMSASARLGRPKTPFLRTSNVLWDEIDLSTVDEMAISPEELSVKSLRRGDLLVCEGGEIGRSAIWEEDIAPMAFQNHLHRLRPAVEGVEPRFYVYFFQSAFTQLDLFRGAGNQTTIPNLSRSRLSALEVPLPNREEQRIIAETLRFVRMAVGTQQRLVALAQELRQAALRYLFTRGPHEEPTKDTEIGPIPRSWEAVSLGRLCDRGAIEATMGQSPPSSTYNESGSGLPFFQGSADFGDLHPTPRIWCVSARKFASAGETLLSVRAPVGDLNVAVERCGIGRGLASISAGDDVDPWFLYFVLLYRRSALERLGTGSTFASVSRTAIDQLGVPFPTKAEQTEIASTLLAVEKRIETHRRKLSLLEQLFRTLLHDLMTGRIRADDLELPDIGTDTGANTIQDGRE